MNLRGEGNIAMRQGVNSQKKGEDAPQDLEQQDLEEKLLHVGVFCVPFVFLLVFIVCPERSLSIGIWKKNV